MRRRLEFEVRGTPAPQGDHTAFIVGDKARVTAKNRKTLDPWRNLIGSVAQDVMGSLPPLGGPVAVVLAFRPAPRPASHYLPANSRRAVRELRLDAPVWHTSRPDADKLARAALDALTAIAYDDDARVVELRVMKRWPAEGEAPGVTVRVTSLEETA